MRLVLFVVMMFVISAALVGGFLTVGGPQQGRNEQQDRQRLDDLLTLKRYLSCSINDTALPVDLNQEAYCRKKRAPSVFDPQTGLPYVYRLLDENVFEVCATFQAGHVKQIRYSRTNELRFEGKEGCLTGHGAVMSKDGAGASSDKE